MTAVTSPGAIITQNLTNQKDTDMSNHKTSKLTDTMALIHTTMPGNKGIATSRPAMLHSARYAPTHNHILLNKSP